MGKLEREATRTRRLGYLQQAILGTIAVSGILLVSVAVPAVVKVLSMTSIGKRLNERVLSALTRLARNGLIAFEERGTKRYARITEKGRAALQLQQQQMLLQTTRKRRWDRRYRLVIFDIAEAKRTIRIRLREMMRAAGFLRLQDSVWVYPYDCEDFVALLKADLRLGREMLYIIAEKIENDGWLRQEFNLPRH